MEVEQLDLVLVPLGLLVFGAYHAWLIFTLKRCPTRTVIGLQVKCCEQWVFSLMTDPLKNGVLAVQTIRNSIMGSTLLATTAITLSSLISVFVSTVSNSYNTKLVYGSKSGIISSVKYFTLIVCFLVAFLCNVQSIRYYGHVSFMSTIGASRGKKEAMEYAAQSLVRGCFFWCIGLRAFYLAFPLFFWIFGPIPMFACSCILSIVLYFLDTTNNLTRHLHCNSFPDDANSIV